MVSRPILVTALLSTSVFASENQELKRYVENLQKRDGMAELLAPFKTIITSKDNEKRLEIISDKFLVKNQNSLVTYRGTEQWNFTKKIVDSQGKGFKALSIRNKSDANIVIRCIQGVCRGAIGKNKIPDFSRPANFENSSGYLSRLLGYDGIIIGKKDQSFIAMFFTPLDQSSSQAILLKNSSGAQLIKPEQVEISHMVLKEQQHGIYGMFEVLMGEEMETVPLGTKVILGRD